MRNVTEIATSLAFEYLDGSCTKEGLVTGIRKNDTDGVFAELSDDGVFEVMIKSAYEITLVSRCVFTPEELEAVDADIPVS